VIPTITLIEMTGRRIELGVLPEGTGEVQEVLFDFGTTPSGTYMLEIRNGDGEESSSMPIIIVN
jgi:hypothetical protein